MGFIDLSLTQKKYDTEQKGFLLDLVSGCIEQKKVLDVVVNTFYEHNGKLVLKADYNRFSGKLLRYSSSVSTDCKSKQVSQ